jgi:hypothetical protein
VHDALLRVAHVEQPDAGLERGLASLDDEGLAPGHPRVVAAAGKGIDDVVHRAEHPARIEHPSAAGAQALQGDGAGPLVQERAVDRYQRGPVAEVAHDVQVPELVEQCSWHRRSAVRTTRLCASRAVAAPARTQAGRSTDESRSASPLAARLAHNRVRRRSPVAPVTGEAD